MMKHNQIAKQQGLTMISWMIVIALGLFFTLVGIKMAPTYMEDYSIKQIINGLNDDRSTRKMDRKELKKTILKRLKINSVYDFDKDKLTVKKTKHGLEVAAIYEVRKPIAGNVSVVMSFNHTVELRR